MVVLITKMRNIENEKKIYGVEIKCSFLEMLCLRGPLQGAREWEVVYRSLKLEKEDTARVRYPAYG